MNETFLTVDNLHKSFNEHKVVNGISFSIYEREIFGLLGPNGAGKTTTLRILSTVLEPNRGDVTIGGHSIRHDANAVRHLIGVCLLSINEMGHFLNRTLWHDQAALTSSLRPWL